MQANMSMRSFSESVTGVTMSGRLLSDLRGDAEPTEEDYRQEHLVRNLSQAQRVLVDRRQEVLQFEADLQAQSEVHEKSLNQLARELGTDLEHGLTPAAATSLLRQHGFNELERTKRTPLIVLFLHQFASLIIVILMLAAAVSFAMGEHAEGVAVLLIVLINATLATYSENSASNALEALAKLSQPNSVVIRGGERLEVPSRELTVGDLVVLNTGDVVPADIRLVEGFSLKVNEMLLTGESEDVSKQATRGPLGGGSSLTPANMVFSSTTTADGHGRGVVVAVGMETRVGAIARLLAQGSSGAQTEEDKTRRQRSRRTPLQNKLHRLGLVISVVALIVCVLTFVIGYARGYSDPVETSQPRWLQILMVAASLGVSAIPEGLPLCVTICLALGTADMVRNNAVVRNLPAVETLGSAQVICTDKTGTLTEGKMTAVKMWADGREYDITGKGFLPHGRFLHQCRDVMDGRQRDLLVHSTLLAALLCSDTILKYVRDEAEQAELARLASSRSPSVRAVVASTAALAAGGAVTIEMEPSAPGRRDAAGGEQSDGVWTVQGNSSEAPLVVAAAKAGLWREEVAPRFPRVAQVPFSSKRKMMVTVHKLAQPGALDRLRLPDDARYVAVLKGAPNYIVDAATQAVRKDGAVGPLEPAARDAIMQAVDALSSQALRVLAVAMRPLPALPASVPEGGEGMDAEAAFAELKQDLTFVGLVASIDPERTGVRESIETARGAGVRTIMITGDYLATAVAIARNINLIMPFSDPGEEAVDCEVLRPTGDYLLAPDIDAITSRVCVFARARPEDKLEIVRSLQRQGLVAAMTGDGVNDAPALNEADIGIAMGITGTEVAKGASDMILTDDNFSTIVTAIRKGRVIYGNIQKFLTYFLGTTAAQVILIFVCVLLGIPTPLTPLSVLFLNVSIDAIPGMAMSVEPGDAGIMDKRPRPRARPIVFGRMWAYIAIHSVVVAVSGLIIFALAIYWHTGAVLMTRLAVLDECRRLDLATGEWRSTGPRTECLGKAVAASRAVLFVFIAFNEIFRAYTVRTRFLFYRDMFSNRSLNLAVPLAAALTCLLLFFPPLRKLWGFEPVSDGIMWAICLGFMVVCTLVDELSKYIFRVMDTDRYAARAEARRQREAAGLQRTTLREPLLPDDLAV